MSFSIYKYCYCFLFYVSFLPTLQKSHKKRLPQDLAARRPANPNRVTHHRLAEVLPALNSDIRNALFMVKPNRRLTHHRSPSPIRVQHFAERKAAGIAARPADYETHHKIQGCARKAPASHHRKRVIVDEESPASQSEVEQSDVQQLDEIADDGIFGYISALDSTADPRAHAYFLTLPRGAHLIMYSRAERQILNTLFQKYEKNKKVAEIFTRDGRRQCSSVASFLRHNKRILNTQ